MENDGLILNIAGVDSSSGGNKKSIDNSKLKGTWREKRKQKLQLQKKAGIVREVKRPANNPIPDKFLPPEELLRTVTKPIASLNPNKTVLQPRIVQNKRQIKPRATQVVPVHNSDEDSELDIFDRAERNAEKNNEKVTEKSTEVSKKTIESSLFTKNPVVDKEHLKTQSSELQKSSNGVVINATSFSVLGLDKALCNHLKGKMKVNKPTVVQSKTISFFNNNLNKDVIIQAQTGSGKTLAFLLPIVNSLIKASGAINPPDSFKPGRMSGLISVVLAPTRELAKQIYDVLNILLNYPITSDDEVHRYHWIVPGLVVGGEKKSSEKSRLRKGVNILIATPGRFLDHLQNTKSMEVNRLKWIVLDEGDRFLELGLQETLKNIFNVLAERQGRYNANFNSVQRGNWFWNSHHLPKVRQTVLVSATLNSAVQKLAEYSLSDPIHLTGSGSNQDSDADSEDSDEEEGEKKTSFSTPQQLTQSYMAVPAKLRLVALTSLFKKAVANKMGKLVVFMLTCEQVDFYHQLFCKAELQNEDHDEDIERPDTTKENLSPLLDNLAICKLHGNMDQASRTASFKQFSNLEHGVLLCTDVAARGLDMPKVGQIIQFDPPTDVKDYVHRVGRTARLGKGGDAILFLLPSEMDYINILKSIKIFLKPRSLEDNLKALTDKVTKDYQVAATIYQNSFEKLVLNDSEIQKQARKAYISNIRAYATHPASEKSIFHVKKLHYGHIAKSFGLREAPSSAIHSSKSNDKQEESGKKRVRSYASTTSKRLLDPNSEFASGTFTTKLSKKK